MAKTFNELIQNQFEYGGQKYHLEGSDTRESTDQLFDDFGRNWLIGTMAKYCLRYRNLARERDILKIATYCYILWLKKGYHITKYGLKVDVLDTNVQQKSDNFDQFVKDFDEDYNTSFANVEWYHKKQVELGKDFPLQLVYDKLKRMSKYEKWEQLQASDLKFIYGNCKMLWEMEYAKMATHDTDTSQVVLDGPK